MPRTLTLTVAALLAFPASAMAAGTTGHVLSVDARAHSIQVVDSHHVVHSYAYSGRLPKLGTGAVITFASNGRTISHVTAVTGAAQTVSYYGRVVHSSTTGLVLALADGKRVAFSSRQLHRTRTRTRHAVHAVRASFAAVAHAAAGVTVNILGLEAGVTVLVTESVDPSGNVTITISLPTGGAAGSEQTADGTVDSVGTDTFLLDTADGSQLNLHAAQATLDKLNLSPCDQVTVTYHQDSAILVVDSVKVTGTDTSGDCADSGASGDAVGVITSVSDTSVTVDTRDSGPMTFIVDSPDVSDGFQTGDIVDVTYDTLDNGELDASDIEYVQADTTGTVTHVTPGSLTVTDDATGTPVTFTADPSAGTFDGVTAGDYVDVSYHVAGGQVVIDQVDDQGASSGASGSGASGSGSSGSGSGTGGTGTTGTGVTGITGVTGATGATRAGSGF